MIVPIGICCAAGFKRKALFGDDAVIVVVLEVVVATFDQVVLEPSGYIDLTLKEYETSEAATLNV